MELLYATIGYCLFDEKYKGFTYLLSFKKCNDFAPLSILLERYWPCKNRNFIYSYQQHFSVVLF